MTEEVISALKKRNESKLYLAMYDFYDANNSIEACEAFNQWKLEVKGYERYLLSGIRPFRGFPLWIETCSLAFMLQEKALGVIPALFSLLADGIFAGLKILTIPAVLDIILL